MPTEHTQSPGPTSAWFAGPKSENGDWFAGAVQRIVADYYAWRRNYFPEDCVVVDSAARRDAEVFRDHFEDRLIELLARLKHDVPFHSPRYAGHMIAEQTLPGIAGYLAAMLNNPNNVSPDAAPVTVRLELEAAQMIARMLSHTSDSCVLMNHWYEQAKARGRYFVSELVAELYRVAALELAAVAAQSELGVASRTQPARASDPMARTSSDSHASRGNGEPDRPAHSRSNA